MWAWWSSVAWHVPVASGSLRDDTFRCLRARGRHRPTTGETRALLVCALRVGRASRTVCGFWRGRDEEKVSGPAHTQTSRAHVSTASGGRHFAFFSPHKVLMTFKLTVLAP